MTDSPTTFSTICAQDATKWGSNQWVDEGKAIIVPFVKAKRAQTDSDDETWEPDRPNPTLNEFDTGDSRTTTAVVFTAQRVGEEPRVYTDATPALLSRMGTGGNNTPMVAQTCAETSGPLLARDHKDINTDSLDSKLIIEHSAVGPLTTGSPERIRGTETSDSGHIIPIAQPELAVRRLTPLECERLMGWPDNHTLHRADGKHNSDSTRYRMCGNGIVAPVSQWIAKHLHNTLTND